jgi:hypothetical protein
MPDIKTGEAVVGSEPTDEPFPFTVYAALASARDCCGPVVVHARHLPYGVWWDRLRPTVELVRGPGGPPPDGQLPLDGVWAGPNRFVTLDDPNYDDLVAPYRAGRGLF